ncbi:Hsp33 family molecular chaperone HslO [Evansella halocellulosilytica]|uniref:Hsp33 family molecular chaperone HslO n=1 Tax=Evansella halocellulosilytica TaxID=2011013 RepID=UPI000BB9540C|nr:Hsp33 family molecular chaperone HslO [Evansella halocellulosilytica]
MMENVVMKSLINESQVRLLVVDNTKLINEILNLNKEANTVLKLALGKTLSVMSIISGTLKGNQRISLQITLSNPKYKIFADADAQGNVRGYINENLSKASFDEVNPKSLNDLIGHKGKIRIIKGSEMNQFTGITNMPYGNIVDDISHYFVQSEQTPTFLNANMKFGEDGCLLFSQAVFAQLLPNAQHQLMQKIKDKILSNQLFNGESNIKSNIRNHFNDVKILGHSPVQFFCGCSKEMLYGMLHSLEKDEIEQAINNKEPINTVCQICGRTFTFEQNELQNLL